MSDKLGVDLDRQSTSVRETETIYSLDVNRPQANPSLPIDRPYEQMNITGVTGLPPTQIPILKLLGAIED